jgi:hypothetical protein
MLRYVFAFALGCTSFEAPIAVVEPPPPETSYEDHWTEVRQRDQGQSWAHPDQVPLGQMPRRLEVEHLRNSIPRLFGGIQWVDDTGRVMWDRLSRTLGEADYLEVTETNSNPSPLFAKFMDDMAWQVCGNALDRDNRTERPEERLILRFAEDRDANLRWLRLKFHGIYVAEDATEGILAYRQLHQDLLAAGTPGRAWLAVCVAMITAPEFLVY